MKDDKDLNSNHAADREHSPSMRNIMESEPGWIVRNGTTVIFLIMAVIAVGIVLSL